MRKIQAAIDNLQQEMIWLMEDYNAQRERNPPSALTRKFSNLTADAPQQARLARNPSEPAIESPSEPSPKLDRPSFARKFNQLTPQQREGLEEAMRSPDLKRVDKRPSPKKRIVPTHVAAGSASSPISVASSQSSPEDRPTCVQCGRETNGSQLCRKTYCANTPASTPDSSTAESSPEQFSSESSAETATPSPNNHAYWKLKEAEWHSRRNQQLTSQESFSTLAERAKVRANELFEDGFQRRRGEKMKHWVTRIIEGIDAGDLPFMNPEALRKILKQVPDFHVTEAEIAKANSFIDTADLHPLYEFLSELEYHLESVKSEVSEDAFASGFSYKAKGHRRENVREWVKRLANSIAHGQNPFRTVDGLENVYTRVGRVKAGGVTPTRKEMLDAFRNLVHLKSVLFSLVDFLGGSGGKEKLRL
jgi:hypothetical protein